ncbi:hypothetical protein MRB53_032553 [Persea americana]|uniref:Uncharacterized protein n=1 Tax=Persea americana TaxID=3435 RepID=A0ACC2KSU9_PERAE|nr:hypothetical protein MRB53_032553 [Persea americana]
MKIKRHHSAVIKHPSRDLRTKLFPDRSRVERDVKFTRGRDVEMLGSWQEDKCKFKIEGSIFIDSRQSAAVLRFTHPMSSIRHITTKVGAAVVQAAVAEELAEGHCDVGAKELMHMSKEETVEYVARNMCISHITTDVGAAFVQAAFAEELAEGHCDVGVKELTHMSKEETVEYVARNMWYPIYSPLVHEK